MEMMKVRVHLTEVIDFCPKKFYFRLKGYPTSVPHIYSVRGTIIHKGIEMFLKGKIDGFDNGTIENIVDDVAFLRGNDYKKILYREKHYEYVKNALGTFMRWYDERLRPDLDKLKMDIELELNIDVDGITITGTPDLVLWGDDFGVIIDFKTGSRVSRNHELQLVGYEYMLSKSAIVTKPIKALYDVYIGNGRYREVPVKYHDVRMREFEVILYDVVSQIKEILSSDKMPEGVLSNKCIFCDYRGVCNG